MRLKPTYILNSLLALLCLIAFFGGLVYRFYSLNRLGVIISLILVLISFVIIQYFRLLANKKIRFSEPAGDEKTGFKLLNFSLLAIYILAIMACFFVLFKHGTANAITSPWQVVPKYFFAVYLLATISLISNIIFNKKIALALISLHYFLSFSVALVIYKLGYGYDQFVHQATENLIDKTGSVDPKPFYYLGQYALIVILHKITAISIAWLDKLLVPVLAAIYLPVALWQVLKKWFGNNSLNLFLVLSLLALTFPFFIVTTPQNLAFLFLILTIFIGLACNNHCDFCIMALLSLTALITQPVAGIPAVLFSAMLAVYHADKIKFKKTFYSGIIFITVFILPALFYFLNKDLPASASAASAANGFNFFSFNPAGDNNLIINFVYFFGFNLKFAIAILAIGGIFLAVKYREQCRASFISLAMAAALFMSYILTTKLSFGFLISYEQNDYPQRILLAAVFFLLPFIIFSLFWLLEKISRKNYFVKLSLAVFLVLILGAALYLSYPRYDAYYNSRGLSVSGADVEAVNWIDADAKADFIVLANQQVGAAALKQFGFKKYFPTANGEMFYYPIPTSSPLYQYYLDMVYKKPSRETMFAAMELAGVNQGYFVLNKYWWAFPKILAEAKLSADSFIEFGNGQDYVFKYERK